MISGGLKKPPVVSILYVENTVLNLLNYLSIIKPIPLFFDFCSFIINLEIGRNNKLFKFLLFLEDCFNPYLFI